MLRCSTSASLALSSPTIACAPADDPVAVFEYVWQEFDALYGPFAQRGVDWDASYASWRPAIRHDSSDDELWQVLTGMLEIFDDGHVKLIAPGRPLWEGDRVRREREGDDSFDVELIRGRYLDELRVGPELSYLSGRVADDLPYIWLAHIADNLGALEALLDRHPGARGLIIDLRHNSGGDFTWAFAAFGRLTTTALPVFRSRTRKGPERGSFDEWRTWSLEPRGRYFGAPITLLTDRWTISAGERAAMALQRLPETVTIGARTNGSLATMIGREAPNGWYFSLPVQELVGHDGSVPEGIGLPVDLELLNDPLTLQAGTDELLEQAIARYA
ncbi:MAG: S41 family peptidase [Enhygromyxa sp.]